MVIDGRSQQKLNEGEVMRPSLLALVLVACRADPSVPSHITIIQYTQTRLSIALASENVLQVGR